MIIYIALFIVTIILLDLFDKRKIGLAVSVILIFGCILRYAVALNFVESVLLTLFTVIIAFITELMNWRVKHPRYIITSTFVFMCISILIYTCLAVGASAYFISTSVDEINYVRCIIEGAHFAINAMITGSFDRNNSGIPYAIMGYLKTCRTTIPYYMTAVFMSIAPLSALGWFISLFDTDVFLHIKLVILGQLNKEMYVFSDASERSVLLAKEINKIYKKKRSLDHCTVFVDVAKI